MGGLAVNFGHDFSAVRREAASFDRHKFPRQPHAFVEQNLPRTYGRGLESVEVRELSKKTRGVEVERSARIIQLELGANAVRTLKDLGVAEISVVNNEEIPVFERALSLLAGNWQRLIFPGPGQVGLTHYLGTDEVDMSTYVQGMANLASSRFDGELFMNIKREETGLAISKTGDEGLPRRKAEPAEVRQLFTDLGLVPPESNYDPENKPVVRFDILRVFGNGGFYWSVIQVPFELLLAQAA
jgi:hypothetical protein